MITARDLPPMMHRLGFPAAPNETAPANGVACASDKPAGVDLDTLVAGLMDEQKPLLAAIINSLNTSRNGSQSPALPRHP